MRGGESRIYGIRCVVGGLPVSIGIERLPGLIIVGLKVIAMRMERLECGFNMGIFIDSTWMGEVIFVLEYGSVYWIREYYYHSN